MATPRGPSPIKPQSPSEAATFPPTAVVAESPRIPPPIPGDTETFPPPLALSESEALSRQAPTGASPGCDAVPGYEIIRELGRGGMGVVYEARHRKLNRLVALKMILAGGHAGPDAVARFRTEAEAIARLQHPNIVQIHEVGEQDGLPYFSLEFCGGGSLEKKLNGTPLPPREAAALVETLARAMQAAHEKHVIHRDLKPANVLLAEAGTPKITDFGLAKKLDEAGQTVSGAVMGTPSYMAPEQAGGKSADIGPAVDVYAMGAILYECLTGRPPFKAATALDTVLQVVSDEPVPPSQLQTKTPRDLETICLRCLHKEARKRYGTARELADDLRRFLGGEPIRARPVGRMERAAKWVRRNPLVTALVALVVLSVLGGAGGVFVKYLDAKEQEGIARGKAREALDALSDRDAALKQARDDAEVARTAKALADEQKTLAETREREKTYHLATCNVLLAQAAWDSNNAAEARERLAAVPLDLRKWEWHFLTRQYQGGIFPLYGHTNTVTSVAFSPDGTRLATASSDQTARLWDARPLPLPQDEELEFRLGATRPEPDWHEEQFQQVKSSDRFAAAFHLDRVLAYRPSQRADRLRQRTTFLEATLNQDARNAAARLLLARTAWHSPTLGPKDTTALLPSADEKGLLPRRTRAGLLMRQQKPTEAVTVLEAALKDRGNDKPPVEELLLAWAYHETKQADRAKESWTKATAWLDHGQEAVRAANVVGTLPGSLLPSVAMLWAPPADPRYNAFDWETWHELDVLRRELAPRFEAKKP